MKAKLIFSVLFVIIVIIGFVGLLAKGCDGPSSYERHDADYFHRKELNDQNMGKRPHSNANTQDEYYYEKVRCHKCYGLGTVIDLSHEMPNHSKCSICNGTGYVMEKKYYKSNK